MQDSIPPAIASRKFALSVPENFLYNKNALCAFCTVSFISFAVASEKNLLFMDGTTVEGIRKYELLTKIKITAIQKIICWQNLIVF